MNLVFIYMKICPCCNLLMPDVSTRRMSTAYVEEKSNYLESCQECYDRSEESWAEMWEDYHRSIR